MPIILLFMLTFPAHGYGAQYSDLSTFTLDNLFLAGRIIALLCMLAAMFYGNKYGKSIFAEESKKYLGGFKVGVITAIVILIASQLLYYFLASNMAMLVTTLLCILPISGGYSIVKANLVREQSYSVKGFKRIIIGLAIMAGWYLVLGINKVLGFLAK